MNTHTELEVTPLLTNASEFHTVGTRSFFSVSAGVPVVDALHEASCFLAAGDAMLTKAIDSGLGVDEVFGIRFLMAAAKALVDSSTAPIQFGNRQGGAK
ncbi:hypothetical protein CP336_27425 [Pseudomonas fluorescens]|nr:hypothetical protein CP336_27425 [Pseudomonas fluorescens]